jgi:alkylation response protein AidB-like acyl-CoA dehydrogenase
VSNLEAFQKETRSWLEENCPASMRLPMEDESDAIWGGRQAVYKTPDAKKWLDAMGAKGWTVPTWPKEYGGGGLSSEEAKILSEELKRIKARPALLSFGIWMLGPVLLELGSEEQKKEYLPKIARGEIRWCQGYSEPGAGSDLAGLQTRAEDKGDHWLVNGQKIWTSYADQADWIFCLVRTDTSKKHDGISFLLFDMASEGVETKPIKLISGSSPFCETFFTNVKVPKENLVYELNKGWTVAKRLLQFERNAISDFGGSIAGGGGSGLETLAKEYVGETNGSIADAGLRGSVADFAMDSWAFGLTLKRIQEETKKGPTPATSIMKFYGAEHNKRRLEMAIDIMGTQGLGWEGEGFSQDELDTTRNWLRSKGNSIEGGTSEVQLNIIAKRVLGLPD